MLEDAAHCKVVKNQKKEKKPTNLFQQCDLTERKGDKAILSLGFKLLSNDGEKNFKTSYECFIDMFSCGCRQHSCIVSCTRSLFVEIVYASLNTEHVRYDGLIWAIDMLLNKGIYTHQDVFFISPLLMFMMVLSNILMIGMVLCCIWSDGISGWNLFRVDCEWLS